MFEFVSSAIESTATLVSAALYELACDPDVQNCLRKHLDNELNEHQRHITIDQLGRLHYLENVMKGKTQIFFDLTSTILHEYNENKSLTQSRFKIIPFH